jgi:hypothetical protein
MWSEGSWQNGTTRSHKVDYGKIERLKDQILAQQPLIEAMASRRLAVAYAMMSPAHTRYRRSIPDRLRRGGQRFALQ